MQIVEISGENRYLSVRRGFLVISEGKTELGKVPLDMVCGVIGAGHGITLSQSMLARLAVNGIPYVVCDNSFSPVSVTWPLAGHHAQSTSIRSQLETKKPLKKRMWQTLVKAKIKMQAFALGNETGVVARLNRLSESVKSGDPENLEAQAARIYWPAMLGTSFRRDRNGKAPNNFLNYGYTILRSAMARSVAAAGLHPSIGLHHSNQFNPFVLVDDLIEPFRPFMDLKAKSLSLDHELLDPDAKHSLVSVLHVRVSSQTGVSSLLTHIKNLAQSTSKSFRQGVDGLLLPDPTALEIGSFQN